MPNLTEYLIPMYPNPANGYRLFKRGGLTLTWAQHG
jgi:hypothetical protein